MSVNLVIKALRPSGQPPLEIPLDIETSATVEELKEQIAPQVDLPKDHIRLVCAGRIWDDAHTVGSYGASNGSVVHCLNNPPKQAPATAEQRLQPADPMQSLMGMGGGMGFGSTGSSNDPMQNMMAQAQRQMMQNPEMIQQLMNMPMVQQMLSDPETIRAMARMNPQLNQLMEQRPEIARILEDPEVMQQSMRMIANPALMREMTRNADRAIGQLDAIPGGHNALRRAHEEFADPLFDALTGRANANGQGAVTDYSQPTQGTPNIEALPNPWGPPQAAASPPPAAAPLAAATGVPAGGFGAAPANAANPLAALLGGSMQGGAAGFGAGTVANPMAGMTAQQPGVNPMAAMMQQMMANPAFMGQPQQPAANEWQTQYMQQMLAMQAQMRQAMAANAAAAQPGTGTFPGFPAATPFAAGTTPAAPLGIGTQANNPFAATMASAQRARFASQLQQLAGMGFTNETVCLQALTQHNGRIDAAIDTLLSSPDTVTPDS